MICSMMDTIANHYLVDSMACNFDPIVACLGFVFPLIDKIDPEVGQALSASHVAPHVTLSWCITWFSHDVQDPKVAMLIIMLPCEFVPY